MVGKGTFLGHPRGLTTLFFTEMWERTSYYGMRAILILFMTTPAVQEGLGLDSETAGATYGIYTASVYLLSLPGGWLADKFLGQRKAIWYGGILIMVGHVILAIPSTSSVFFTGLGFVAAGTGFLKPNISSIVGDLYPEGGARRDAGFSLFYMGINLGSFLGQLIVPFLAEKINWHYGFGFAAIGMLIGLIQYRLTERSLGEIGLYKPPKKEIKNTKKTNYKLLLFPFVLLVLFLFHQVGWLDFSSMKGVAEGLGVVIVILAVVYFGTVIVDPTLDVAQRKRIVVIFLLFVGSTFFWAGFEQAGSSLNLFARDYTDRFLFGWELPAGWLQNVNATMVIIFAPIIGALWIRLSAKQMNPSSPIKFGLGLILMAIGFLVMYFAAKVAIANSKAGMEFLVFTYFFHSIGELTLSPVGLSVTTKLAPRKYYSQMMGVWFLGISLGNLVAGLFASGLDPENSAEIPALFMSVVIMGGSVGVIFLFFAKFLSRWMGGVK